IALGKAAQAWAFIDGRDFVTPDDVQVIFASVTEHRLGLNHDVSAQQLNQLLNDVNVPL
ncbi:hypothetical protein LCGC14_3089980, partial [marine sediment metagenome]